MKQNKYLRLAGAVFALGLGFMANSQTSIARLEPSKKMATHRNAIHENEPVVIDRRDVNQNAIKNFARNFKKTTNEKWFRLSDGLLAAFTLNDIQYRVDYDKSGNWLHTIMNYGEQQMEHDLRHLVKTTYYDYTITLVQKIEKPRTSTAFIIHLEGSKDFVNLKICDGDMEEMERITRSLPR